MAKGKGMAGKIKSEPRTAKPDPAYKHPQDTRVKSVPSVKKK